MVGRPRGLENVQYMAKAREEFFRRLTLTGNVSKVAKELGFVRITC